jgi:hypothetical protein
MSTNIHPIGGYRVSLFEIIITYLVTRDGVYVLVIGFIGHLQHATASNYSDITNSHTLQFIIERTNSSLFVFSGGCLVTAANIVDSSGSVFNGFCPLQ